MNLAFWHTVKRSITPHRTASFVILLVAATVLPTLSNPNIARADINNTRADAWGTLELSGTSWLSGVGVDVNSNGSQVTYTPNKPNNTVNGIVSGEEWQCVEMVNRLYLTKGWTTATWTGSGNTLINNMPSGLTKENDGSIHSLSPGDVITLDDGGFGHAGIINTVGSTIQIVNQNTTAVYSSASLQSGTSFSAGNADIDMTGWAGYFVQAVVHHPATYWIPLAGDWDGNGTKTIGLYDPTTATFYLRNSNTSGVADITAQFGSGGNWVPIVGNWDGVGGDTIGVYDPSTARFHLSNYNTSPQDNYSPVFGSGGNWVPLAGNWDGYLSTTIGVYNPSLARFYLSNSNTSPNSDYSVVFGSGGSWEPVVGDWDGNGTTTIGIYNPGGATFYLSNSNTSGSTDISFTYGNPN
jgi:CHAP domain